ATFRARAERVVRLVRHQAEAGDHLVGGAKSREFVRRLSDAEQPVLPEYHTRLGWEYSRRDYRLYPHLSKRIAVFDERTRSQSQLCAADGQAGHIQLQRRG